MKEKGQENTFEYMWQMEEAVRSNDKIDKVILSRRVKGKSIQILCLKLQQTCVNDTTLSYYHEEKTQERMDLEENGRRMDNRLQQRVMLSC